MRWPDTARRKRPPKQKRTGERNVDSRFQGVRTAEGTLEHQHMTELDGYK